MGELSIGWLQGIFYETSVLQCLIPFGTLFHSHYPELGRATVLQWLRAAKNDVGAKSVSLKLLPFTFPFLCLVICRWLNSRRNFYREFHEN